MRRLRTSSLANVQDEPRPQPARLVLLGARDVTDVVVGSSAWLGIYRVGLPSISGYETGIENFSRAASLRSLDAELPPALSVNTPMEPEPSIEPPRPLSETSTATSYS